MIVNAQYYNTLTPYYKIPYSGIAYGHCVDYDHISRDKGLRQVTHNANSDTTNSDRFISLETPNPFTSNAEVSFYDVPYQEENRLDVIAYKKLGSAQYAWIIAYFNGPRYNITLRTAEDITGTWSQPYEIASGGEYAQLYGSYFHPLSADSETLYFTMSMWLPYNVYLMKLVVANIR